MVDVMQSTPALTPDNDSTVDRNSPSNSGGDKMDISQGPAALDENLVLHPLEFEWTFWYDKRPVQGRRMRGEQEAYESNLRPIGSFATVEDFWRYYNHIVKPSKMENNANQHLFKKDIKPMWEDAANARGGKWIIVIKDKQFLDNCWENLVLAMVGETLEGGEEICGAVVSRRKSGDKIAIWNKNKTKEDVILAMGRKIKAALGLEERKMKMVYQYHEDSLKTGASYSNPDKYTL